MEKKRVSSKEDPKRRYRKNQKVINKRYWLTEKLRIDLIKLKELEEKLMLNKFILLVNYKLKDRVLFEAKEIPYVKDFKILQDKKNLIQLKIYALKKEHQQKL